MDTKGLACGIVLLHLLIVLGTCDFIPKDSTNAPRLQSMEVHNPQGNDKRDDAAEVQEKQPMHDHSHSSSHMMHHMALRATIFFALDDIKLGNKLQIYFPDGDPSPLTSPYLLPKDEADAIPFSLKQLPDILEHFSIPQGSRKAQVMEKTLRECETKPIKGETKVCVTSYESLTKFAQQMFGLETNIEILSTHQPKRSSAARLQNYTIVQAPQLILTPKMVACHTMPYPYTVFHCHSQEADNRVYKVSLYGEDGERIEAIAVCHMDTSLWNHDHVSSLCLELNREPPLFAMFNQQKALCWFHLLLQSTSIPAYSCLRIQELKCFLCFNPSA